MDSKTRIIIGILVIGLIFMSGCIEERPETAPTTTTTTIAASMTTIPQNGVTVTTDKTEYQKGEEVNLTVENNLDEEIEFYNVAVEKFNNNEWQQIRFDIECLGLCEKIQTVINSKNNKSFLWDQKDSIESQAEAGRFRFKIGVWGPTINYDGLPPMFYYYSNEFTIKSNSAEINGLEYCEEDNDCKVDFSNCDCQYHCVNKNIEIEDCAVVCDETGPIISECICENNKCADKKSLGNITRCDEKKVILEGRLSIVHSKYPIDVIETSEGTYWMYGPPKNFKENLNKTVRIEATLSPAYSQNIECNICYMECQTCQCPLDEELLYDIKILEVLD